MQTPAHSLIIDAYCSGHRRVLAFAEALSPEQLYWQASPGRLTIAFFLWHLARWADHIQAAIPGMTPELSRRLPPGQQVWEARRLARAWGFPESTGYAETGMDMPEREAACLAFPPKEELLAYARQAFAAAERAVQAVDGEQFHQAEQPQPMTEGIWSPGGSVGEAIFSHLLHDREHFGMMQALLSQQMPPAA